MEAVGTREHPPSRNQSISGIRGVLSSLVVASLLCSCSPGGKPPSTQPPKGVPVTIGSAVQKSIPIQVRAIGTVEAYSTVSVKTMVGGQIMKVGFSEGQDVRKGDLLFEIDPAPYEAALKMAEAARARDIALKENAEKEVRRYASLVEKNLVPRQQYDQFASSAAALEATVQADTAAVENARVQLAYCFIRSPIDGRTGSLLVQQGNVVKANDATLVTINQVIPIRVSFSIPEQYLADVRKYKAAGTLKVEAAPQDGKADPVPGTLSFIGNAVDPATGTIQLKGTFPNTDRRLWPGQFANVVLTLTVRSGAVVVPSEAIQTGQQGQYVFVVRPDLTVEARPVTTGEVFEGGTVIGKGVVAGEKVVTDGQLRLVPGTKVEPKKRGRAGSGHDDEYSGSLHPPSHHDDPGDGRPAAVRHPCVPAPSGERSPQRRFSDDPGHGEPSRRQPRDDGLLRGHPPRAPVHHDRRAGLHGVQQRPRVDADHAHVHPGPEHRRGRPGRPGGHHQGGVPAAEGHADTAVLPEGEPGGPTRPLPRPVLPHPSAVHGGRVRADVHRPAHLDRERGRPGPGLRVAEGRRPRPARSRRPGLAGNRDRRGGAGGRQGNVNLPTGTLYGPFQAFTLETSGQLKDAEAYLPLVVAYRNGAPVRLRDIGSVVDGVENDKVASWYNKTRAIVLAIQKQPGTNTVEVVDAIRLLLPTFRSQMPASIDLAVLYDRSVSIRDSVHDVKFTLFLAICLVVLVIFLFLRNISATVIPSLALPMSIVGTFAVMYLLGYSLDNLSLMALTLSVGFVVDDAIVMLENIVRHMEKGKDPRQAAFDGSREIGFTILSMTLSLAAVFIPVFFMGGVVGRLLHEFAATIIAAILISGVVSLTLTPMLCSRFLRPPSAERHGRLYAASERVFDAMLAGYDWSLTRVLRRPRTTILLSVVLFAATAYLFVYMPKGFLPNEDTGLLFTFTEAAQGISFDSMKEHQIAMADIIGKDPNVESFMSSVGPSGPNVSGNSGRIFIRLKPRAERALSADEVIQEMRPKLAGIPGIRAFMQNLPPIRIGGQLTKSQYQLTLQSPDTGELYRMAPDSRGEAAGPCGTAGRDERPADREPAGQRDDRPGQGAVDGRLGGADRERALQRLWGPADLHHLRAQQYVQGHPGAVPHVPERPDGALPAVRPVLLRDAGAAVRRGHGSRPAWARSS